MKMKVDWGCVSFETQNVLNSASMGYEHGILTPIKFL